MSEPSGSERGVEPNPGPEGVPGPEPIGVGRVEFHRALNGLHRDICSESAGLRESIGWCLIVLALWLGYLGVLMATQQIRGSR